MRPHIARALRAAHARVAPLPTPWWSLAGAACALAEGRVTRPRRLCAGRDAEGRVTVFDTATGSQQCKLEGHMMAVRALAFTPDSAQLLTGSDDAHIHLHDM